MAKGYTKKKWKKLDMFQCGKCLYSSLNEETIKSHVKEHEPKKVKRVSPIVSAKGEEIEVTELK